MKFDQDSTRLAAPKSGPLNFHLGCVSYLNAKPLIYGLDSQPDVDLKLDVPAKLLDGLNTGRFDVALLPVIDYQRMGGLTFLTAGGIGSEDQTLTVRIFSKIPIENIRTLACDTESHTSVALARIILRESLGIRPEFVALNGAPTAEAQLLIGDKVICNAPAGMDHQLDLGQAWKKLTNLPFLFACWTARKLAPLGDLPERLAAAKQAGRSNIEKIIHDDGIRRGWPVDVARKYLTEHLQYDVGERQLQAVRLFYELAAKHGVIERARELSVDEVAPNRNSVP